MKVFPEHGDTAGEPNPLGTEGGGGESGTQGQPLLCSFGLAGRRKKKKRAKLKISQGVSEDAKLL